MIGPILEKRLRWFRLGVTILLIVVCNALLLGGLWVSGVNLERVLSESEFFDPLKGHCVRVAWTRVMGVEEPVKVCSEWLELADPTGQVHTLRQGEPLALGQDGKLYYHNERGADFRLVGLILFVVVVIGSGMWVKRSLVSWYKMHLEWVTQRMS